MEKVRARERFDGEFTRRRDSADWVCSGYQGRSPCQSGTVVDASFWDGPQLRPAFAAQVIGQALCANAPAYAGAAYGKPARRPLPLVDENV